MVLDALDETVPLPLGPMERVLKSSHAPSSQACKAREMLKRVDRTQRRRKILETLHRDPGFLLDRWPAEAILGLEIDPSLLASRVIRFFNANERDGRARVILSGLGIEATLAAARDWAGWERRDDDALASFLLSFPLPAGTLLARLAEDPSHALRRLAVAVCEEAKLGPKAVFDAMARLARDEDAGIRAAAVHRIRHMETPFTRALPVYRQALEDEDAHVRYAGIYAFAENPPPSRDVLSRIAAHADDPDDTIRRYAIYILGEAGHRYPEGLPLLLRALGDPDRSMRERAVRAICENKAFAEQALEPLGAFLRGSDVELRILSAAGVLKGGASNPLAFDVIRSGLDDLDPTRRRMALEAVRMLGSKASPFVPALLPRLRDSGARIREQAALALGAAGVSGAAVKTSLERLRNDPDAYVREAAARALSMLSRKR